MSGPTLVLVHGAWHGAWCYGPLQAELTRHGIRSRTVELTSHGDNGDELGGLAEDVAAVRDVAAATEGDIVLLGNSYGGMVISQAAEGAPNVSRLLYLSAFLPEEGDSMLSLTGGGPAPWLDFDEHTHRVVRGWGARLFYSEAPTATAEWAEAQLQPQSLSSFTDRVDFAGWRKVDSTYLICTRDQALPPAIQRRMAQHTKRTVEIGSDHSPYLSQPAALAAVLAAEL
jgi:pimeloyl-ACP methyl ester carboxylesterase